MKKVTVYNQVGEKVKDLELDSKIFDIKIKPDLVSQAVIAQQANARLNLANVKDRSQVSGGGRKPWRQKGTGRARHGSIRSPLWRGGGVTFGPSSDQNYSLKINKKVRRKAVLMCLSDKAANDKIVLLDKLELVEAKTKKFYEVLQALKLREGKKAKKGAAKPEVAGEKVVKLSKKAKSVLVILPKKDSAIQRAVANVPRANTILANSLNAVDLLKYSFILMPVDSIEVIEKTFVK
ncbi:MAG: 50S ribosomal protein L4 [Patescibacteria group bacterium]|nr:50S ribosomal protein L4 [Patescibacteria group bacterium]